jgi:hypothetical protein
MTPLDTVIAALETYVDHWETYDECGFLTKRDEKVAREALTLAKSMGGGWLPIAEAPFNEPVLLFGCSGLPQNMGVAICWEDDPDNKYFEGGKHWCIDDGKETHGLRGSYPTHFQPLPQPPEGV